MPRRRFLRELESIDESESEDELEEELDESDDELLGDLLAAGLLGPWRPLCVRGGDVVKGNLSFGFALALGVAVYLAEA